MKKSRAKKMLYKQRKIFCERDTSALKVVRDVMSAGGDQSDLIGPGKTQRKTESKLNSYIP